MGGQRTLLWVAIAFVFGLVVGLGIYRPATNLIGLDAAGNVAGRYIDDRLIGPPWQPPGSDCPPGKIDTGNGCFQPPNEEWVDDFLECMAGKPQPPSREDIRDCVLDVNDGWPNSGGSGGTGGGSCQPDCPPPPNDEGTGGSGGTGTICPPNDPPPGCHFDDPSTGGAPVTPPPTAIEPSPADDSLVIPNPVDPPIADGKDNPPPKRKRNFWSWVKDFLGIR